MTLQEKSTLAKRLLALGIGVTIASILAIVLPIAAPGLVVAYHEVDLAPPEAFAANATNAGRAATAANASTLVRLPFTPELSEKYFRTNLDIREFDPDCYYIQAANLKSKFPIEEHPDGVHWARTNSIGCRRDSDLLETKGRLRVAVAGDSHIEGVCNNSENLCALIEDHLRESTQEDSIEVVNFAVGGYSFFNYLGILERCIRLELDIDAFVVILYGGNDFADTLLWHHFRGEPSPPISTRERRLIRDELTQDRRFASHYGQYMVTADFARTSPRELDVMKQMALDVTQEIKRLCDAEDIELLITYLPSPTQVPDQADLGPAEVMMEKLDLDANQMAVLDRLADDYLGRMQELGIATIDLRVPFEQSDQELYWKADSHLNLNGHALAAKSMQGWFEDLLAR